MDRSSNGTWVNGHKIRKVLTVFQSKKLHIIDLVSVALFKKAFFSKMLRFDSQK